MTTNTDNPLLAERIFTRNTLFKCREGLLQPDGSICFPEWWEGRLFALRRLRAEHNDRTFWVAGHRWALPNYMIGDCGHLDHPAAAIVGA